MMPVPKFNKNPPRNKGDVGQPTNSMAKPVTFNHGIDYVVKGTWIKHEIQGLILWLLTGTLTLCLHC